MNLRTFQILQCKCLSLITLLVLPISAALADIVEVGTGRFEQASTAPVAISVNLLLPEADSPDTEKDALTPRILSTHAALVSKQFGVATDPTSLENERGGSEVGAVPLSGVVSNGSVGNNRAVDVVTGSNTIREGSFANASGIPVVIQNTGANVLIQNSTIVNVQLR